MTERSIGWQALAVVAMLLSIIAVLTVGLQWATYTVLLAIFFAIMA